MSSIPNRAIPHAGPAEADDGGETLTMAQRAADLASRAAGLARDNPKTAIAAGAAVVAGAAAAAAIPLVRARRRGAANGASAGSGSEAATRTPARKRAPKRTAKKG
jgi:hypothetical protein